MGVTKIEWCDYTFNHVRGCSKVSPGCENCYAATMSKRNPGTLGTWGPQGTRVVASEAMWREPLKWDAKAKAAGERHRVFCASMADVFEDWDGPMVDSQGERLLLDRMDAWRRESENVTGRPWDLLTMSDVRRRLFALIDATPNLDWLLLTKRPENIARMMAEFNGWRDEPRPNVWLGVSVENQEQADKRIPILLQTPAAVRFLSMEPLLGPVTLDPRLITAIDGTSQHGQRFIDWIIVGGESGHGARPMHPKWARSLRDQCQAVGVPFFFKQWGEWGIGGAGQIAIGTDGSPCPARPPLECTIQNNHHTHAFMSRLGKKAAGRLLDGREWNEYPSPRAS